MSAWQARKRRLAYWRILQRCRWVHRLGEERAGTDCVQLFEIDALYRERAPGWQKHRSSVSAAYELGGADGAMPLLRQRLEVLADGHRRVGGNTPAHDPPSGAYLSDPIIFQDGAP